MTVAMACALRGAAFLDKSDPGWLKKVSPVILDIRCARKCVLGQLHGNYFIGVRNLGLREDGEEEVARLGFQGASVEDYVELNVAWRQVLQDRLRLPVIQRAPAAL
jgi:hypothetical protein